MNGHALMERAGEQMNVPPDKIQAFLNDGWKIVGQPAAPEADPAAPVEETLLETVKKTGKPRSAAPRK
jgi:hypothetical protein